MSHSKNSTRCHSTPWGIADSMKIIAPGITWYSTPSHGGYHLSDERIKAMPPALRDFKPWAGEGWYEEDCDWCVVVLAFPEYFSDHVSDHDAARKTLKHYQWRVYEAHFNTVLNRGESRRKDEELEKAGNQFGFAGGAA